VVINRETGSNVRRGVGVLVAELKMGLYTPRLQSGEVNNRM
jgi:hypothetical protein